MAAGRSSNFELLRVVCMIMIMYHHISRQTKWNFGDTKRKDNKGNFLPEDKRYYTSANHLLVLYLGAIGKIGVHVFVMISGYFTNTKSTSLNSIIRLWFRVVSWTWSIMAVMYFFIRPIWLNDFKAQAFPVLSGQYWYVSTYFMVMFMSPWLSLAVKHMSQRQLAGTITIMILSTTVTRYFPFTHKIHEYLYTRVTLLYGLYLLGAYFRQYPKVLSNVPAWFWFIQTVVLHVIGITTLYHFSNYDYQFVAKNGRNNCNNLLLMASDFAPLALAIGISMFLWARKLELPYNPLINWFGNATFGVYVIHENLLLRPYLWDKMLKMQVHYKEPNFYLMMLILPMGLYVVMSLAEYTRQLLMGRIEQLVVKCLSAVLSWTGTKLGDLLGLERTNEQYERIGSMA